MPLDKTLNSHSASLHPGVIIGTRELSGKADEMLGDGGVTCHVLTSHPGGVAILLVASWYINRYKLRSVSMDELNQVADFT